MDRELHRPHLQLGTSLIELMMAMTIGFLVLGALLMAFSHSNRNRLVQESANQVLENGRYAMSVLKAELILTGFYGSLALPPATGTVDEPCTQDVDKWSGSLAVAAHGANQDDTSFTCISRKSDTDAIFIQRAGTCVSGPTAESGCDALKVNDAYLQVSECGVEYVLSSYVLARYTGAASTDFPLKAIVLPTQAGQFPTCAATGSAAVRKYYRSFYYVDANSGLNRLDVNAGADAPFGTPMLIAAGIENLQIEYAIDSDGDGTPDGFSSTPSSAQWPTVVGARIALLARADKPTAGYVDDKTYVLGDLCSLPPGAPACSAPLTSIHRTAADQGYKRHAFVSYVGFVNVSGRRQ